jgi:hypothetical protein
VSVACCLVEVSATSWSLVQRSPTECSVSLCDLETSYMTRPWPTGGCCAQQQKFYTDFRKIFNSQKSVQWEQFCFVSCRRTGRETHDEATVTVSNFESALKSSVSESLPLLQRLSRQIIAVCSGMG